MSSILRIKALFGKQQNLVNNQQHGCEKESNDYINFRKQPDAISISISEFVNEEKYQSKVHQPDKNTSKRALTLQDRIFD